MKMSIHRSIHIIRFPAYDIFLVRPFNVLEVIIKNFANKDQTITIIDPNSRHTTIIPTIPPHLFPASISPPAIFPTFLLVPLSPITSPTFRLFDKVTFALSKTPTKLRQNSFILSPTFSSPPKRNINQLQRKFGLLSANYQRSFESNVKSSETR